MNDTRSAFWDFSLAFYTQPGAAAACLELQEHAGADVNLVLYLFFLALHERRLDAAAVTQIDSAIAAWRDAVVRPLRAVRRHLKSCPPPFDRAAAGELRNQVKRDELAAERLQQLAIEQTFPPATTGARVESHEAAARASIAAYGMLIGALPGAAVEQLIEIFKTYKNHTGGNQ